MATVDVAGQAHEGTTGVWTPVRREQAREGRHKVGATIVLDGVSESFDLRGGLEHLEAMNADSGVPLTELRVDGGMTANETLMQFQADQVNVPVVRPVVAETTALGAAYAAGIAVGFWEGENDVTDNWAEDKRWEPKMDKNERERLFRNWKKAVTKTFDWVDDDVKE